MRRSIGDLLWFKDCFFSSAFSFNLVIALAGKFVNESVLSFYLSLFFLCVIETESVQQDRGLGLLGSTVTYLDSTMPSSPGGNPRISRSY